MIIRAVALLGCLFGAYLIGSINFAVIFARVFLKNDVRELGSGNAGTTNVMRTAGFLPGLLTFVCDALKGFVACLIPKLVFTLALPDTIPWIYVAYFCGVMCMLGHVFPVFFQFRGGKGVATSVGIYAVCCPIAIVIGLAVFALLLLITRIVSLSSLTAAVTVVTLSIVFYNLSFDILPIAFFSIIMGCIVFAKHAENIMRLVRHEEKKLKFGGKKNG